MDEGDAIHSSREDTTNEMEQRQDLAEPDRIVKRRWKKCVYTVSCTPPHTSANRREQLALKRQMIRDDVYDLDFLHGTNSENRLKYIAGVDIRYAYASPGLFPFATLTSPAPL